jgi:hypothetical protein
MTSSGEGAIPTALAPSKSPRLKGEIVPFSSLSWYLTDLFSYISADMTFLLKPSPFLFDSHGL